METMIKECQHCKTPYQTDKSRSSLKLTWCGILCEVGELGYVLSSFEKSVISKKPKTVEIQREDKVIEEDPADDDWEEYELCPA